ncbi:MAG: glycosyltransferase [Deltaproteobacteria bacterium]|nr:glycosyltransferase [Deltaproteobacteria bacterium]MBN2672507.1 glycosyltransferase [Deltaproteobacteria bacterium]
MRPRIALLTNHGYAGVEIPVGGAPDTGGQNFYVNSKAKALDQLGMEVTIFTRGGFPFYGKEKIRQGVEQLSEHIRYVYVPGGGTEFIRKEDIAPVLKEEAQWLAEFIETEAAEAGIAPWQYYECFDTHYWDAAVIGIMLVERWQNDEAYTFFSKCLDGKLSEELERFEGENKHKYSLCREAAFHFGLMARAVFDGADSKEIIDSLLSGETVDEQLTYSAGTPQSYAMLEEDCLLGQALLNHVKVDGKTLPDIFTMVNRHVWTPHSLGIIKERNYWDKNLETVRALKFCERNDHEETICKHAPLFCSTSPEIWATLYAFYKQKAQDIFDFPPCLDTEIFRPRKHLELTAAYAYLAEKSGLSVHRLQESKIVFESSRMDRTKRKDILVRAFARVARETDDTYLFIGGGPDGNPVFKDLRKIVAEYPELEGRAFLLGFMPSFMVGELFSVPDLYVSASEMEGFGMSVSQAASAGVAVVSSDLIPFATQFASEAAVVVPAGEVDAFAEAMLELLSDDEQRQQRAEQLYAIAQELNWVNTSRKYIDWYRKRLYIQK